MGYWVNRALGRTLDRAAAWNKRANNSKPEISDVVSAIEGLAMWVLAGSDKFRNQVVGKSVLASEELRETRYSEEWQRQLDKFKLDFVWLRLAIVVPLGLLINGLIIADLLKWQKEHSSLSPNPWMSYLQIAITWLLILPAYRYSLLAHFVLKINRRLQAHGFDIKALKNNARANRVKKRLRSNLPIKTKLILLAIFVATVLVILFLARVMLGVDVVRFFLGK